VRVFLTFVVRNDVCARSIVHGNIKEFLMRTLIASSSLLAALVAAPAAFGQASPVCLKDVSGMANCVFQTVAQCEAAKGMNTTAQCVPRADANSGLTPAGTTGQGSPQPVEPLPRPSPQR
jgi:hypothetical protein